MNAAANTLISNIVKCAEVNKKANINEQTHRKTKQKKTNRTIGKADFRIQTIVSKKQLCISE